MSYETMRQRMEMDDNEPPETAGEVERELREWISCLDKVLEAVDIAILTRAIDTIAALEAERGRLRAAMEEAAKIADLSAYYNGNDDSRREVAETIAREIRAASQQGKGD